MRGGNANGTMTATYERPIEATLHVHLATGEQLPATEEDLARFGLVKRLDANVAFDDLLTKTLTEGGVLPSGDLTRAALNPLRYLVEMVLCHPRLLEHPDMRETFDEIVQIERTLQRAEPEERP